MHLPFVCLLILELRSQTRDVLGLLMPILFLLVLVVLFPLAFSSDVQVLQQFAVGISWLGVLLSMLLNLNRFFSDEKEQGMLEQMLAGGIHTIWHIQARILAHWLTAGVPLSCAGLLVAFVSSLPVSGYLWLFISLLVGSLIMISLGAFIAMLAIASNHYSFLLVVLLIPLLVPLIIFSVELVNLSINDRGHYQLLLLLVGLALVNMVLSPLLITVALKTVLD